MSKRARISEERKDLDPAVILAVQNVEKDVTYRLPHLRSDREPPVVGGEGVVEYVTTGAAAETIQTAARKYVKPEISLASTEDPRGAKPAVTYELAELEILRAVSGKRHMPTFLGAAEDGEKIYMYYQPWCPKTLRDWLDNPKNPDGSKPSLQELQKYGQQLMLCMTAAVHELHALQPPILHRDIKPENFCLTSDGSLLCVDFGVSKLCTDTSVRRTYAGTVKYMAPEVASQQRYSRPAEVFSLGAVYCEIFCLMTGARPRGTLDAVLKNGNYSSNIVRTKALEFLWKRSNQDENLNKLLTLIGEMLATNPHDRPEAWRVHDRLRALRTDYTCCHEELPDEEADPIPTPPSEEDEDALANFMEFE